MGEKGRKERERAIERKVIRTGREYSSEERQTGKEGPFHP